MYITTNLVLTTNIQTESSHVYPKTKLIKKDKPVPNLGIRKFVISKDCSLWTWLNENKKMVLLHIYKRPIMNTLSKKHLVLFNCNKTFTHTKSLWNTCKKKWEFKLPPCWNCQQFNKYWKFMKYLPSTPQAYFEKRL